MKKACPILLSTAEAIGDVITVLIIPACLCTRVYEKVVGVKLMDSFLKELTSDSED